jgi:hypothetical protein
MGLHNEWVIAFPILGFYFTIVEILPASIHFKKHSS